MRAYVYSMVDYRYVAIIDGDSNAEVESKFDDRWDSNDYGLTYSTGLRTPRIGDVIPVSDR